jgi:hypothetical protein
MMRWLNILIPPMLLVSSIANAETPTAMPGWLTGAWIHNDGSKWADEYWTPPRGGLMIGASRSGEGDILTFWEHMRVERDTDGGLAFVAIAADQKPVRFVMAHSAADSMSFENADHDYPQRIHYWREGNRLRARISLLDGSKAVNFEYTMIGAPE